MTNFIHLRNHTEYSLCSGAIKIKELIKLATKNRIPAVGITDNHNMFGALEFSEMCMKAGIQPIVGCELITDFSPILGFDLKNKEEHFYKIVLFAKTDEGFLNLISLLSQSYLKREDNITPHLKLEDIGK